MAGLADVGAAVFSDAFDDPEVPMYQGISCSPLTSFTSTVCCGTSVCVSAKVPRPAIAALVTPAVTPTVR